MEMRLTNNYVPLHASFPQMLRQTLFKTKNTSLGSLISTQSTCGLKNAVT